MVVGIVKCIFRQPLGTANLQFLESFSGLFPKLLFSLRSLRSLRLILLVAAIGCAAFSAVNFWGCGHRLRWVLCAPAVKKETFHP